MDFSRKLFYVTGIIIVQLCNCNISSDFLPSPSLVVRPTQTIYDKGQKITLICSPPNNINAEGIRYFRNVTTIIHTDRKKEAMTHYTMIIQKKKDDGVYNCDYWVNTDGKNKLSLGSNEVNIIITDSSTDNGSTPSWIHYITGGIVIFCVSLISCLLYKRAQRSRSPNRASENHSIYHNSGHDISQEPVRNLSKSALVHNQLINPIYSIIFQNPTPASEQLLSMEANTMMTDPRGHVAEGFQAYLEPATFSKDQETAHIYSEIGTEMYPNNNNHQHPTPNSKDFSLKLSNSTLYSTAHVIPLLSSTSESNMMEPPNH
ncbi:uncharacterized protein [Ranitomeya imitator]|uniref:uncharacterized protein n=1 Tax=Ranitomeya imitator TaxID=111125 RepID=UPI0037E8DE88